MDVTEMRLKLFPDEPGNVYASGRKFPHDNLHVLVSAMERSVSANRLVEENIVVPVDVGLPMGYFPIVVDIEIAICEKLHRLTIILAETFEVCPPCDSFRRGIIEELDRLPVVELNRVRQSLKIAAVIDVNRGFFQVDGLHPEVWRPVGSSFCESPVTGVGFTILDRHPVVGVVVAEGEPLGQSQPFLKS